MSLVFSPIKVLPESFMTIKDPRVSNSSFLNGDETEKLLLGERRRVEKPALLGREGVNGYSFRESDGEDDGDGSSESSSIGVLSSSSSDDEEEKGDEGQSKLKDHEGILGSLDSLEESLPVKRGLSNFFAGKSKSFASLSDAGGGQAKDLVKHENPFNKRRRILMSHKASWRRRASCTSLITSFPPLLTPELIEEQSDEEGDDPDEQENCFPLVSLPRLRSSFKNPRSLSLSDLQKI